MIIKNNNNKNKVGGWFGALWRVVDLNFIVSLWKKIETWYLWYFVKWRTKFMLIFRWQAHDLRVKSAFRYSEMLILSSMGWKKRIRICVFSRTGMSSRFSKFFFNMSASECCSGFSKSNCLHTWHCLHTCMPICTACHVQHNLSFAANSEGPISSSDAT